MSCSKGGGEILPWPAHVGVVVLDGTGEWQTSPQISANELHHELERMGPDFGAIRKEQLWTLAQSRKNGSRLWRFEPPGRVLREEELATRKLGNGDLDLYLCVYAFAAP